MKVKNGIASSVSLRHDAENPLRQRLQEVGWSRPSSIPMQPEDEADGGKREGDRIAEQQEHDQAANMIGAMLWMKKAVMACRPPRQWLSSSASCSPWLP